MKRYADRNWRIARQARGRSAGSKRRPRSGVLTEYRFENPGQVFLRTRHPDEAGYVDTTGDIWKHACFGSMDWRKIHVPKSLKRAMQHYIVHELEAGAPLSAFTRFGQLLAIQRMIDPKIAFPLRRERTFKIIAALHDQQLFCEFRRFYRWATTRGIPGFDRVILLDLEELRAPVQQRRIDARDPARYLTDDEQRLLLTAFETIPSVDDPGLRDHVLVQLCWELGCRPDQARGIDERHVHLEHLAGEDYGCVEVPRIKQSTTTLEYKRRPISSQLAAKILLLLTQNRNFFGPSDPSSPIFRTRYRASNQAQPFGGRFRHTTAASRISNFISEVLRHKSGRGARMLRHNMAQRMADMGAPAAAVAEALDHSDLTSVAVYVRLKPDVSELKTRALGKSGAYRDVLNWLNGRVPIPRAEANSGSVVQGMVADRYIGGIGVCALPKDTTCSYNPVYSCYGCSQFTPFVDGDHDAVADAMAQENLRLMEIAGIEGNRVALANEYPIIAAKAVQALCTEKQRTR